MTPQFPPLCNVFSDLMLPVPTFPQWLFIALDVTPHYGNLKNRRFRLAMIEISKIEIWYHNKANNKANPNTTFFLVVQKE